MAVQLGMIINISILASRYRTARSLATEFKKKSMLYGHVSSALKGIYLKWNYCNLYGTVTASKYSMWCKFRCRNEFDGLKQAEHLKTLVLTLHIQQRLIMLIQGLDICLLLRSYSQDLNYGIKIRLPVHVQTWTL